jgi:hypothetical protein
LRGRKRLGRGQKRLTQEVMRRVYGNPEVFSLNTFSSRGDSIPRTPASRAGIFKQSVGDRKRVGIGLSYRPPGYIGWRNSFLGIDSGVS